MSTNMEVDGRRSNEHFLGAGTIRRYCRLLRRLKIRKLRPSPPPNEEPPPPLPRTIPEKCRYALKADVAYEFKKLDLFRRCDSKIDELNRIFVRYSNHRTPSPRTTISKEMVKRNIMRRLRSIDVQMQALMEDIRAKRLELERLKGDVETVEG